jgi:dUTP pyrophosphatase
MRIQRLTTIPDFPLPLRSTEFAGAFDLHAAIPHPLRLEPGEQAMVGTGYAWEIPVGTVGLLLPRSGKGSKEGAVLATLALGKLGIWQ